LFPFKHHYQPVPHQFKQSFHIFFFTLPCYCGVLFVKTFGNIFSWCILCKSTANEHTMFNTRVLSLPHARACTRTHTHTHTHRPLTSDSKHVTEYLSHIQTLKTEISYGLAPLHKPKLYFLTLRDTIRGTLCILISTSLVTPVSPWSQQWLVWLVIWYHHEVNQSIQLSQNAQLTQLHERKRWE
jgi:hypothetical protein